MTYLPGLRASLVDAARQRYVDSSEPEEQPGRRRRANTGQLAAALGAAVAVAVAAIALAALGNRQVGPRPASSGPATQSDLRAAAAQALSRVVLPRGAVVSGLHRGTPIELWSPSDTLRIPGHVDVYRVWRLRETPDRLISFMIGHRAAGSAPGFETSAGSGTQGGQVVVQQATTVISLPVTGAGIWRELALNAVTLPGGGTGLRVDSEAGWLMPRPASERIPPGVLRVAVTFSRRNPYQHGSPVIANPARVRAIVSAFNSLPAANPPAACKRAPDGFLRFAFEGAGRNAPLAVATWAPSCRNLELTIGGREIPLVAGAPTMPIGAQIGELLASAFASGELSGRATATLNSSQRCATSMPATSAKPRSGPGAAVASCTSASRSTTTVISH